MPAPGQALAKRAHRTPNMPATPHLWSAAACRRFYNQTAKHPPPSTVGATLPSGAPSSFCEGGSWVSTCGRRWFPGFSLGHRSSDKTTQPMARSAPDHPAHNSKHCSLPSPSNSPHTLMFQQPTLPLDPSSIPGQRSIRSNHAVTWHHHSHRVCAVRQPNRPHRLRSSNLLSQLGVRNRCAASDSSQSKPHFPLKRSARCFHRQGVNGHQFPRKVTPDCLRQTIRIARRLQRESIDSIMMPKHRLQTRLVVAPNCRPQISFAIRHNGHLANRRLDPINQQLQNLVHLYPRSTISQLALIITNDNDAADCHSAPSMIPIPYSSSLCSLCPLW